MVSTACSCAVMRMVPAGLSRNSLKAASSASISSNARAERRASRRSPASVGATLRVVRVSSRSPSRASSPRTVWLSADCETPSLRRRPGEAALPRDGEEGEEVVEFVARHS